MPTLLRLKTSQEVAYEKWLGFVAKWKNCQECELCTQRNKIVLAKGQLPCDVLYVGESPGQSENVTGIPFHGPAGQLLDNIIASAKSMCMVNHFTEAFTNLVCCFPAEAKKTDDHRPTDEQIQACSPRLQEFVEIAKPKLVVCVGSLADSWAAISSGAQDVKWVSITHPSAILRMPIAQKGMAARRCAVVLKDAVEVALLPR